ncbi:hypothetical protein BX666DRAFT_2028992 [Dichotomocladium elegans]|nr:hypothetical protein BX666DRAFT_2028992 [Dichotomocladium elegans]
MQSNPSEFKNVRRTHSTPRFLKIFGILRGHPKPPPSPPNIAHKHAFNVEFDGKCRLQLGRTSQEILKSDDQLHANHNLKQTKALRRVFSVDLITTDLQGIQNGSADESPSEWHIIQQQDLTHSIAVPTPSTYPQGDPLDDHPIIDKHAECEAKITELHAELEKEKTLASALQRQKEGLTQDLHYCNRIIEEATQEKIKIAEQLEKEKAIMKHMKEDMSILLEKMRAATAEARDRSRDADRYRKELEEARVLAEQERISSRNNLKERDDRISEMEARFEQTEREVATLRELLSQQQQHLLEQQKRFLEQQQEYMENQMRQQTRQEEERISVDSRPMDSANQVTGEQASSSGIDNSAVANHAADVSVHATDDLDTRLRELTEEKERLQSAYSKIPISGGSRFTRRRKEELEEKLDKVDVQLCRVKHRLRGRIA